MESKVKAAVLVKPGHVEIREFDMPALGKGSAICKVLMAGVCGTDKHSYRGETVQYKGTENEIDLPFPIIQGHEIAMEIVAIDEEGARNLSFRWGLSASLETESPSVRMWYVGTVGTARTFPIIPGVNICSSVMETCAPVMTGTISMAAFPNTSILNPEHAFTRFPTDFPMSWPVLLRSCV